MAEPRALDEIGDDLATFEMARQAAHQSEREFITLAQAGRWEEAEAARLKVLANKEAEMDAFVAACRRLIAAASQIRGG